MKLKFSITTIFLLAFTFAVSAQNDFNYSFYPSNTYTNFKVTNVKDTTTKEIVERHDTLTRTVAVAIEKQNDHLAVRTLSNVSETLYQSTVRFVGIDESGNLVYKAQTENAETVFVNPMAGTLEIVFQTCFTIPKPGEKDVVRQYCDTNRHIFGNIQIPKPKPSVTPIPNKN